jgi:carbamoyl-phosphate synthase large subunit
MKILITGVGGVTPRSFAQALRKYSRYSRYELIGTDSNQYALGLYMPELFNKSYLVPKVSDHEYWPVIDRIIDEEKIDYAIINPELEVVEWAKRSVNYKFPFKVLLPDYNLASILVDKAQLANILEPYGFVPKSFTLTKEDANDKNDLKLPFPFWIRSALGSSGLGSMKINSHEELINWMNANPKVEKFLASEFLPGRNLGCKMLYYNGELLRSAIAERVYYIMAKVAPSGITGNTCFGRLVNDQNVFNVAKQAMDIMFEKTKSPKQGFFTVDLKEDAAGKAMVTEVNIRFVAFAQCYAAGGANLPEDLIRVLDDDPLFDRNFKLYEFEPDMIFLRDVDEQPIIMKESQLLSRYLNE